jgi:hypothetical protein
MTPSLPPPEYQPVTVECVVAVSQRYQLPVELLAGILAQEHGKLGQSRPNRDGSRDLGPMQVNSFWLPMLRRYGVEESHMLYHGCYNLAVGAWIVRYEASRHPGGLWQAVGRYHSPNPQRAAEYALRVAAKARAVADGRASLDGIIRHANGESS